MPAPRATPGPSAAPTPIPADAVVLPAGTSLFFVLDDRIDSAHSRAASIARIHLKDALVLGGVTIAPAGSPGEIRIVDTAAAQIGNVDGSVDIYFEPLKLRDGQFVPLSTPSSHLTIQMTAGAAETAGIEDTIKNIIIPYHFLYSAFRKGSNLVLGPGTLIRAHTAARIDASKPGIVSISSPPPFTTDIEKPYSAFSPSPFATVPPTLPPNPPKPKPSPSAVPTPSATP
ncbi:MAG: hypothetical protein ABI182_06545 [Candidatus Baltobacteraceae bacterium]